MSIVQACAPAGSDSTGATYGLINFVQNELVLEVREDTVDDVRELLRHKMTEAFLDLFKSYQPESMARGLVEVGVGSNYAEVK